jgi:Zn-dependent protease
MKTILSLRKHRYVARISIFLVTLAFIGGIVGCGQYAAPTSYTLAIAATTGGSVITPGQGNFTYTNGTVVNLMATPANGYLFAGWTGDVGTIGNVNSPTTTITISNNCSITSKFVKRYGLAVGGWHTVGLQTGGTVVAVGLNSYQQCNVTGWTNIAQIAAEPPSPVAEFVIALAGPLTSFVLAALFGLLWFVSRGVNQPIAALSGTLAYINALLGAFNLIPGFPLDGGRVFRSILWGLGQNLERATRWASLLGQGVAYLMIIIGIWQFFSGNTLNGLWLAFIGWFLDNAAQSSYQQVATQRLLAGHTVREIMNQDCTALSPNLTLDTLVNDHILATGRRCFPGPRTESRCCW